MRKNTSLGAVLMFMLIHIYPSPAQEVGTKSDLQAKVDSIIRYELRYVPDSTTDAAPSYHWDTTLTRGLYPSFSSLPANPSPLIILDGESINLEKLKGQPLEQVREIKVYPGNDPVTLALYGISARNGLIVISTSE